jgi:drug/metabolite transporter (DMT)-like permease
MNGPLKIILGSAFFALIPLSMALSPGSSIHELLLGRLFVAAVLGWFLFRKQIKRGTDSPIRFSILFIWSMTMLVAMLAYFKSIQLCGMGLSAMLLGTQPVIIFLLSIFLFSHRIKFISVAAVVLCSVGIVLISLTGKNGADFSLAGVFLAILSALLLALNFTIKKRFLIGCDSMYLIVIQSIIQIPFVALLVDWSNMEWSVSYVEAILLLGVCCTIIAYRLIYDGITHTESSLIGVYQSTEYVMPMLMGLLFFGENYSMTQWLGCGIILSATLSVELLSAKSIATIE